MVSQKLWNLRPSPQTIASDHRLHQCDVSDFRHFGNERGPAIAIVSTRCQVRRNVPRQTLFGDTPVNAVARTRAAPSTPLVEVVGKRPHPPPPIAPR
jgi:hypothetical protein